MIALELLAVAVLSAVLCRAAMLIPILDRPDGDRKQQAAPVPRTGSLAAAIATGTAGLFFAPELVPVLLSSTELTALVAFVAGAFLLGSVDDIITVNTKLKLILLAGLALVCSQNGNLDLPLPSPLIVFGVALWLFTLPNVVNFMDGANGLAMGCMAIFLSGSGFLMGQDAALDGLVLRQLSLFAGAALVGFLFLNLGGRIYAGDAGALGFGAAAAALGLVLAREHTIWLPATMALPLLVDALLTILWRLSEGHNVLNPHRHHTYQLLISRGWSHYAVSGLFWALTSVCVLAAISASKSSWEHMPLVVFAVVLVMLCSAWAWSRRYALHR